MGTNSAPAEMKLVLEELAKVARGRAVIGWEKIVYRQHALLVITAIKAFGDDPRATFYIEHRSGIGDVPRPDLILLHPEVGVLVIENKGVQLRDIQNVQGTSLSLLRDGRFKREDPFDQSEKVRFRLGNLSAKRCRDSEVLFLHTAALPQVNRRDFESRFGIQWPRETLFADACSSPLQFRDQVVRFSEEKQRDAKRKSKLSKRADEAVRMVLDGKSYLHGSRTIYLENADPNLIGIHVQELELGLKNPTDQQREHGEADMRGQHRLFRGVAGSGKSILLSLSAAQTAARFAAETGDLFTGKSSQKRVLVVCFNRTLVHYLRQRIDDVYGRLTWDKPKDDMLTVVHFEGLVKRLERLEPRLATGLTFREKEERVKLLLQKFQDLDENARDAIGFDAVYLDEAQDLLPDEITLLLRLARKDEKGQQTFIIFYDNAQNIYGVTQPVWEKLGANILGGRTVFLDKCLRNTAETLSLAFNVLVGSFAPEGERVTTRTFADVGSLRQRGLITEKDGRFEVSFALRTGPSPSVKVYPTRDEEIRGVAAEIRWLVVEQRVMPSDILVLYKSHYICKDALVPALERELGKGVQIREVRSDNNDSKSRSLIEDGTLTISTIASAKGYDAPIVFLLGVDELATDTKGRASFYVGATRAKLILNLSGMRRSERSLLDEAVAGAQALAQSKTPQISTPPPLPQTREAFKCRHCQGTRLHAQHGRYGYFFVCIDCAKNTPLKSHCAKCGDEHRIRKEKRNFFGECKACKTTSVVHTNVSLEDLEEGNGEPSKG
jgi:superfamily I DNA and RNA helicase